MMSRMRGTDMQLGREELKGQYGRA